MTRERRIQAWLIEALSPYEDPSHAFAPRILAVLAKQIAHDFEGLRRARRGAPQGEDMRRVIVESPFGAATPEAVEENKTYARRCLADCLRRDESPYASHLLLTQEGVLDDSVPAERYKGIAAGFAWRAAAERTVVYTDRGVSEGMKHGLKHAASIGQTIEYRQIGGY